MTERNYLSIFKDEPEVLTVLEVAKLLRIGKNAAYGMITKGSLSSIKVGGKIIVPKMSLVAFLLDAKNYQFQSQIVPNSAGLSASSVVCCRQADDGVPRQTATK